jgi:hypothetical protein
MFPDVFAGSTSKHELQLFSFYEKNDRGRNTIKLQPKQKSTYIHAPVTHLPASPVFESMTTLAVHDTAQPVGHNNIYDNTTEGTTNSVQARPPILPALRRITKFTVSPGMTSMLVVLCAVVNMMALCFMPQISFIETLWAVFLQLWFVISLVQIVSHSVYVCSSLTLFLCSLHMSIISVVAILFPPSQIPLHMWVVHCVCSVLVAYQAHLFCLVYTHIHKSWVYASFGVLCVLISMTQTIAGDTVHAEGVNFSCLWSVLCIYTLYIFAFFNSRGSTPVDVAICMSPSSPH